jgi:hypothetical protein
MIPTVLVAFGALVTAALGGVLLAPSESPAERALLRSRCLSRLTLTTAPFGTPRAS